MEVDQNKIEMWRHWERDGIGVTSMQEGYFAGWLAAQRTYDQALAAAEAECAAARTALSPPPLQMAGPTDSIVLQPSPARRWADLRQAANANDATRERLGLGRIGEVAK
jgi:hypothetical protein